MKTHEALKRAREHAEYKQEDVAKILYTSQAQLSLYETGKRQMKTDQITILAKLYKVSTDYLLGLTDDPKGSWLQNRNR